MPPELTSEQQLQSIWQALRRIESAITATIDRPIQPNVTVATTPPDLAEVVNAVNGLRPGPTADEIARALAGTVQLTCARGGTSPSMVIPAGSNGFYLKVA